HRDTLKAAGVHRAGTLILSASGLRGSEEVLRLARELNPDIRVLARAAYLRERTGLLLAGADEVFTAEGEIALAMAEEILTALGATPEQIDRERDRLREEGIVTREKNLFEPVPFVAPSENTAHTEVEFTPAPAVSSEAVSSEPDPGTRAE
ncbi:MAG: NAD-binding protein, partial [Planctomycetia bacterium]|nr:NAD-binding protein [Planctomycetia bacterium]